MSQSATPDYTALAQAIKQWGRELGFQQVGIADTELGEHERHLLDWLAQGGHGAMDHMAPWSEAQQAGGVIYDSCQPDFWRKALRLAKPITPSSPLPNSQTAAGTGTALIVPSK